ncbi:response regulator [Desertibaculum subflavum]|uniref:response regulator n=1 Tax=Desertibaculum subflavum TaxID=2268458 RepID=UPI000E664D61
MSTRDARGLTAVIADDHQIVRSGLRGILEGELGFHVVGEATNGLEAISAARRLRPTLLLLDYAMPLAQGYEVFVEVRRWSPATKVIVFTGVTAQATMTSLVSHGVDGLFLKRGDAAELVSAVPRILAGEQVLSPEVAAAVAQGNGAEPPTRREMQVLALVARGMTNAEIAVQLGISAKTVDNHRTNLMRKLAVHSTAELLAYALREGYLDTSTQI